MGAGSISPLAYKLEIFHVIQNYTDEYGMCKFLLVMCTSYTVRSKSIDQILVWLCNLGWRVVEGHWKWHQSIDHIRLCIGLPL